MRVVECDLCGELVSAVDDESLAAEVARHLEDRHPDAGGDESRARDLVDREAYTATDS